MKKYLLLFASFIFVSALYGQRAKIEIEAISPEGLITKSLATNSVSNGLHVVPNQTFVYLSALNIGNTEPITNSVFTFISKPGGSNSSFTVHQPGFNYFKPDVKGEYKVNLNITTASGSDDTTISVYAGNFVGVGNFEGVSAVYPNCMTCHSGAQKFIDIFNSWKVSGHGQHFKTGLTGGLGSYYGTSCFKCHTTGFDHNVAAANDGFDDRAAALGWTFVGPPNPGKFDSLKTMYPQLSQFATIGCEMCHGPGGEHATNSNKLGTISVTVDAKACGQCHDEPWRHNYFSMWRNSTHSNALWSSSFAQGASSQNNNLQNCIRCHDSKGYVNFTKGLITNTTGMLQTDHEMINCVTCHDPHGNVLRNSPASSDTLGNGYAYTISGKGKLCMDCHKARRDNVSYTQTNVTSAHWGPHHNAQADIFLGQNAAEFGSPYPSSGHKFAVADACVQCHMTATPDTGNVNRDKIGGHSFKLYNAETNKHHTEACVNCHGPKNTWNDFIAAMDYDGDGMVEGIPDEILGLEHLLKYYLPPVGVDSISWQMIGTGNDLNIKKAYWNYQLIEGDASKGMHNAKYTISVLTKSILAIGGFIPVELTSFDASFKNDLVTLNWETASETNNKGFAIERKTDKNWMQIAFVSGKGTSSELNKYVYNDDVSKLSSTKIFYRLRQVDLDGKSTYSKEVMVDLKTMPREYVLEQNFPNPFNPTTNIKFTLPKDERVKLLVYNAVGALIKILIDEEKISGNYTVNWDATNSHGNDVASGIYYYKLQTPSVTLTKKMVLIR